MTTGSDSGFIARSRPGPPPSRGWRRFLPPGAGARARTPRDARERGLAERIETPIDGYRYVALVALKGGEGKTTTAAMLGTTFAEYRGDRVVAMDASPDVGTLGYRIRSETSSSVRDLVRDAEAIERYSDVRRHTSQAPSGLEVVAGDTDVAHLTVPFQARDYLVAADILSRFYSVIITDCAAGLLHEAMRPVLMLADQVVVVSSLSVDGGRSGSLTLDWLEANGHEDLVRSAVVVLNATHSGPVVAVAELEQHFRQRARAVVAVPWDAQLATGVVPSLDGLRPATRRAYLRLAATVAESFEIPTRAPLVDIPPSPPTAS